MKLLQQPKDSNLCGQYCAAMLIGRSPKRFIEKLGRRRMTYKQLSWAISEITHYKYDLDYIRQFRCEIEEAPMRGKWIAKIGETKYRWNHYVVINNGVVYDPIVKKPMPYKKWLAYYRRTTHSPHLFLKSWTRLRLMGPMIALQLEKVRPMLPKLFEDVVSTRPISCFAPSIRVPVTSHVKPTIILAGNRDEFDEYFYNNLLSIPLQERKKRLIYGNDIRNLYGIEAKEVIIIGTFWHLQNAWDLHSFAKTRVR